VLARHDFGLLRVGRYRGTDDRNTARGFMDPRVRLERLKRVVLPGIVPRLTRIMDTK